MNNYSGILYRVWGVCGILFCVGVLCVLIKKPWMDSFSLQKCKEGIIIIIASVLLGLIYLTRIIFPDIDMFAGEFVSCNRDSRVAPPLPLTDKYLFENEQGDKNAFFLDILSKKEIIGTDLIINAKYMVYYDSFTKVIVRIEQTE